MEELLSRIPYWRGTWPPDPAGRTGARQQSRNVQFATVAFSYLSVALLLRAVTLGNPTLHIDEQFYLLVGDRMLHGALPYVDIWDRKPIGLFLVYAAIRALGGQGIYQYQGVALIFAAATAMVVWRLARHIAAPTGAWLAGIAYLMYLSAFNGFGGQAPVFYNLPMALAALILVRALTAPPGPGLVSRGSAAMALVGLAIQVKYTVVFEGVAMGLALIWRAHAQRWPAGRIALAAVLWAGIALAPTAAALLAYVRLGHGEAFIQANFLSIFGRQESMIESLWRLVKEMAVLTPFWLAIFHAPSRLPPQTWPVDIQASRLLRWWAIAAFAGFLVFGTWYDHYVGPLLLPLAVLSAPALGRGFGAELAPAEDPLRPRPVATCRAYTTLMLGFGLVAALYTPINALTAHGPRWQLDRMAAAIERESRGGCVYINEGEPVLYLLTNACLATRWIFPNHLAGAVDAEALGIDVNREMAATMARRPAVVMVSEQPISKPANAENRRILLDALARDYRQYAAVDEGKRTYLLFRLRKPGEAREQPAFALRPRLSY